MGVKLNDFTTSWYRIMLNIKLLDKVSNDRITIRHRHQPFAVDSHLATAYLATLCARRRMNPPTFTRCISPPTGEDPQGDRGGPSPAKFRDGLTPTITSHRVTSCALPKTEPVEDTLQSTVPQPTDDERDSSDDVSIVSPSSERIKELWLVRQGFLLPRKQ